MEKVRAFVNTLRELFPIFEVVGIIDDLESRVEDFGVKVYYSDMEAFDNPDNISGYSVVNDHGLPEIIVNGTQSEERRRFTIAHELGHIVMHWKWLNSPGQRLNNELQGILFRKNEYSSEENIKEWQANEFAAELLAPLELIKEELRKSRIESDIDKMYLAHKIARSFKISTRFAEIQVDKVLRGS